MNSGDGTVTSDNFVVKESVTEDVEADSGGMNGGIIAVVIVVVLLFVDASWSYAYPSVVVIVSCCQSVAIDMLHAVTVLVQMWLCLQSGSQYVHHFFRRFHGQN